MHAGPCSATARARQPSLKTKALTRHRRRRAPPRTPLAPPPPAGRGPQTLAGPAAAPNTGQHAKQASASARGGARGRGSGAGRGRVRCCAPQPPSSPHRSAAAAQRREKQGACQGVPQVERAAGLQVSHRRLGGRAFAKGFPLVPPRVHEVGCAGCSSRQARARGVAASARQAARARRLSPLAGLYSGCKCKAQSGTGKGM